MYIANKTKIYPCTGYGTNANTARFFGVAELAIPIVGEIVLCRDDGFELATQICENYTRQTYENEILVLTNELEPIIVEPTEPIVEQPTQESRISALEATQSDVIDILASALGVTI